MANQIARHVSDGRVGEIERDEHGTLWITSKGKRERWQPEDGDWVVQSLAVQVTRVQIAELVFAADVELRKILGIREAETQWLNLRPERRALWIDQQLPEKDNTPRFKMAAGLREFLESLRVDD